MASARPVAKWEVAWDSGKRAEDCWLLVQRRATRNQGAEAPPGPAMAEGKDKFWAEMSPKEQAAAKILGWDSVSIFSSS